MRPQIIIRPRRRGMGADIVNADKLVYTAPSRFTGSTSLSTTGTASKGLPDLSIAPLAPVPQPAPVLAPLTQVQQPAIVVTATTTAPQPVFDQAAQDAAFAKQVAWVSANTTPWTPDAGNIAKQAALDAQTYSKLAPLAPYSAPLPLAPVSLPQTLIPAPIKTVVLDPQFIPQDPAPPINLPSNTPATQRILEALSPSTGGTPTTGRTGVYTLDPFAASIPAAQTAATAARNAPLFPSSPPDAPQVLAPDYTRSVSLYPGAPSNTNQFGPPGGGGGVPEDEDGPADQRSYHLPDVSVRAIPWWLIALGVYGAYKMLK